MSEETLLDETTSQENEQTPEPSAENVEAWYFSENVQGEGEAPDWFKSAKYKTVEDQAKAYNGLESKLGAFTGAPEDGYEVVLPEGMDIEIPEDDALLTGFNDWAKEAGLSQEAHSQLMNMYLENVIGSMPNREAEIEKIGKDAPERITALTQWARANLDDDTFSAVANIATTAEGFKALEAMRSLTREAQVSAPDQVKASSGMTEQKLMEMIADERYQSSPAYRAEVEQKFKDFYGTEPAKEIRA